MLPQLEAQEKIQLRFFARHLALSKGVADDCGLVLLHIAWHQQKQETRKGQEVELKEWQLMTHRIQLGAA